jgi:NRAMP (natural resistance-associated macrophage protein)-like metal ion transporter
MKDIAIPVAPSKPRSTSAVGGPWQRLFTMLGPGLITGAADDDPSAIGTYAVVGARLGTSMLWTALVTWPLIAVVQIVCARVGIVTGGGLARALGRKFPGPLVATLAIALLVANTITVGADLSAMADAAEMLTRINSHYYVPLFGILIGLGTVVFRYRQIADWLKWCAFSLSAYTLALFVLQPDWRTVLWHTLVPVWPAGHSAWAGLVGLLGATVSPYLFFWQAALELEEKEDPHPITFVNESVPLDERLVTRRTDIVFGTFLSNLAMYSIMLTTALTLHHTGVFNINTSSEAAAALAPLAGPFATTLFTLGIVGVGLVAIPALITSSAYALAETFEWNHGLHRDFQTARPFYSVIILSCLVGIALDFTDVSPMQALFWASVVSGIIAPFLLLGILAIASDRWIMRGYPISLLGRLVLAGTSVVMLGAAVGMFVL